MIFEKKTVLDLTGKVNNTWLSSLKYKELVKPFKQDIKFVTNMMMKKKLKILKGTSPKAKIDAYPRR